MNLASTVTEPVPETRSLPLVRELDAARGLRIVEAGLLLVAAVFFALHFVHLRADFPNHSIWMDWAKYTDEGWYGDAAIRHSQLGYWHVPGDFNPAAALPVWPLIELAVFRVTGVSLLAARALTVTVFGLCLLCCYALIRRWAGLQRATLAPAIAVVLLAVSPFCFAFMRMAILEPLLILMTLGALLTASVAGDAQWYGDSLREVLGERRNVRSAAWAAALGLLLPAMVLTKTTAVFLFPAVFWMLWAASGYRAKPFLRVAVVAGVAGATAWGGYYGFFVRPRYLVDYHYLFTANAYTGITRATFWPVLYEALSDGTWMGATLYGLALVSIVGTVAVLCRRRFHACPLSAALMLWTFGYGAFLAYHDNLQPRYYLVLAVPLTMLVAIAFDAVLDRARTTDGAMSGVWLARAAGLVGGAALLFATVRGARQTVEFVLHPEYTFLSAANRVRDEVNQGPAGHSRLLLSVSGSDISLMTGVPSICDIFGSATLYERLAMYKPGWFATWDFVDDDDMEALAPMYRLVRVGAFPAYDDPERNLLILYRLDVVGAPGHGRRGRRRSLSVPNKLRTKAGEQPSPVQLKH